MITSLKFSRNLDKLTKALKAAEPAELFTLLWAADLAISGKSDIALKYINIPPQYHTQEYSALNIIHPWELETIALFSIKYYNKIQLTRQRKRLNCRQFSTLTYLINKIRKLEDCESIWNLSKNSHESAGILELYRIIQRQSQWQRSSAEKRSVFRYINMYSGSECNSYFESEYGLSIPTFLQIGLTLYHAFRTYPRISKRSTLSELGISNDAFHSALTLLSSTITDAQALSASITNKLFKDRAPAREPIYYKPSILRHCPIMSTDLYPNDIVSPLPPLIMHRATAGVYYDLVKGGSHLRNEISKNFENYTIRCLRQVFASAEISEERKYEHRKREIFSTDAMLYSDGEIAFLVECKATKLTFFGQFGENPVEQATREFNEIAKGVFQIWRFFAHLRLGVFGSTSVSTTAMGMLVTFDQWLMLGGSLENEVLRRANLLADNDPDIESVDRRKVIFCSIDEIEELFAATSESAVFSALRSTAESKFRGWRVPSILRDLGGFRDDAVSFPFPMEEVLPWWPNLSARISELKKRRLAEK